MSNEPNGGNALRVLVGAAALVIVIAGLREGANILLPVMFAAFLAIATNPIVQLLRRFKVPIYIAIPVVVLVVILGLVGITAVVAGALQRFTVEFAKYQDSIAALLRQGLVAVETLMSEIGMEVQGSLEEDLLGNVVDGNGASALVGASMGFVVDALSGVLGLVSRVLIVGISLTFMLFEAADFREKIEVAFGGSQQSPFRDASRDVQRYLVIKTAVSLATGLLIFLITSVFGLDFPVLWGLLAFLLNYIPSIGSIVAAIPAILLAVVQLGASEAVGIMTGYILVNVFLGNFLEPKLMGRSLGLSPLVVFLSLLFWGWVWGPVGMLFCVPMTVMAKLLLEYSPDGKWIAVLLGPAAEAAEVEHLHEE